MEDVNLIERSLEQCIRFTIANHFRHKPRSTLSRCLPLLIRRSSHSKSLFSAIYFIELATFSTTSHKNSRGEQNSTNSSGTESHFETLLAFSPLPRRPQ